VRSLDAAWERAKLLRSWKDWVGRILEASREILSPNLKGVYVFGSAITGRLTAASDIDILIVAENLPKSARARSQLRMEIEERAGLPQVHPFELHLADPGEAEIYFRHIDEFLKLYEK
jgi:predicted nucleotidyltransferase